MNDESCIRHRVWRLASVVATLVVFQACSSKALRSTDDGGTDRGGTDSGGTDRGAIVVTMPDPDASDDGLLPPPSDPPLPADLVAAPPPEVSCPGVQSVAIECDLPPSTCALQGGCDADIALCAQTTWIVYYENPRCVAGRCVWDQEYFSCGGSSICAQGACISVLGTT